MNKVKTIINIAELISNDSCDVIMYNDDITPMEYVVAILVRIFEYNIDEAITKTLDVHENGSGVIKTTSKDEAQLLCDMVTTANNESGMNLHVEAI